MQIKRHFRKCSFRLGRFAVSKPDVRYQAERDTWRTFCKRVSHSERYLCWDLLGPNEPFSGAPPFKQIRRSQQIRTHETLQPFLAWKYKIATTFDAPNDQASASAPAIIDRSPGRRGWRYYCLPRLRGGQAWAQTQSEEKGCCFERACLEEEEARPVKCCKPQVEHSPLVAHSCFEAYGDGRRRCSEYSLPCFTWDGSPAAQ